MSNEKITSLISSKLFWLLFIIGVILNAAGLFNEVMDGDSALYATVSKQMAVTGDWLNLYFNGHDWLDKPHFPFWMAAISFKLFGISPFTYKLPAFIFWLAGVWFTFRLALEMYNKSVAQIAVLVYVIAAHGVIANFDVRAEPYLTTLTIGAIYYLYKLEKKTSFAYMLLAALFAAGGIMTKGIFILIPVIGGFVIYWAITKQWKQLLHYKWWLTFILAFVFTFPELYSLYVQFDLHPEKIIFDRTGVSGIKFFFWDSQFGRFFNTGPIKGSGDISFFLHTNLWAFLPWSILWYVAVVCLFVKKVAIPVGAQWVIYISAAITFLLFSLSKFQLPHYIIIIFPQFAIMVATYICAVAGNAKTIKNIFVLQSVLIPIVAVLITALILLTRFQGYVPALVLVVIVAILAFILFKQPAGSTVMGRSYMFGIMLYGFLNFYFYPNLVQYQSGMVAAKWSNTQNYPVVAKYGISYSFDFYCNKYAPTLENNQALDSFLNAHPPQALLFVSKSNTDSLIAKGYAVKELKQFDQFHITILTLPFLNAATRAGAVEKANMVLISKK